MRALSRKDARAIDRRAGETFGIPSICLMENAGAGAARVALETLGAARGDVVCVCGPGGNGGDALVVARHLAVAGVPVEILALGAISHGDAAVQSRICSAMRLPRKEILGSDGAAQVLTDRPRVALVVDGLFGIGLTRALDGLAAELVAAMNARGAPILALDVPSGLDCDTGEPMGPCIRATVTATFAAPKAGFANPSSRFWTGDVRVVPLGAPID